MINHPTAKDGLSAQSSADRGVAGAFAKAYGWSPKKTLCQFVFSPPGSV